MPSAGDKSSPASDRRSVNRDSLRKQKAAIENENDSNENNIPIDVSSGTRVVDMIKLSKAKEEQSAAELQGIAKLQKAGIDAPTSSTTYCETVGRAVEEVKQVNVGNRKRCICRRFKCVWIFEFSCSNHDFPRGEKIL